MGLAQDTPKAVWIRLSAGDGGTGYLQYATNKKDANDRTIYQDVKNGLENVYFVNAQFKVETHPVTKKVSKKLHASFEDAVTKERFVITAGWSTSLSRKIIYEAYYGEFDCNKPMSIKTFKGDTPLPNGHLPIAVLISQVPNPGKGDFLGKLKADIDSGALQKTLQKQDDTGKTYTTFNWAEILDPIIDPLGEKLRKAAAARAASAPADAYVGEEVYDDYDEEHDYEESYSAPAAPPVMSFGGTTQQTYVQENMGGTVISQPNTEDIPF